MRELRVFVAILICAQMLCAPAFGADDRPGFYSGNSFWQRFPMSAKIPCVLGLTPPGARHRQ